MRIIGADQYGQYSLLLSQCNLIVALGFGWLNQAQLRYYSKHSIYGFYKNSQLKSLFYSLMFCLMILSISIVYQNLSFAKWIISIVTIIAIGSFNYIKTYYQAKLMPKKIIYLTTLQSLLSLLLPLVLIFFLGNNTIPLMVGIALSFLLGSFIICGDDIVKISYQSLKNSFSKKPQLIKKWFMYGSPLSIWFAAGLALPFLDRYFINHYLQSTELGIFASLQEILVRSFSLTIFPFTLALHPRIMILWNKEKFQEALHLILKSFYIILGIGSLILLIAWNFEDIMFLLLNTAVPEFDVQSKKLILPLLSAGFLWQLSFLTHKMLELKEQTILMIVAIGPSLIINIIGNNHFLPVYGEIATAYSSFFSALSYCIITGIHFMYYAIKIRMA